VRCSYDVTARVFTAAVLIFAAPLLAVVPVAAKDGVHATLTTKVPLAAKPGTRLQIGWRLGYVEDRERRPFGASGVFVRLRSASGAPAETAYAAEDSGNFSASVAVPHGGIADVEIGLRGYTSGSAGAGRSDLLFPITNDPMPGEPRVASTPAASPVAGRSDASRTWLLAPAAGILLAAGGAAVLAGRRWNGRRSTG
jgi:hypothetical protein